LRRLLLRKKPHRVVYADVAMDTRPCAEELWELEARLPEHRHRRPSDLRLKLNMEEPSMNKSKASLSRTSPCHPHITWWK
jgi:hypothetical protein